MEEKQLKRRFLTAAVLVAVAAALLVGGVVTYAWFTSNQRVSTSRVEARAGDESIELWVSSDLDISVNGIFPIYGEDKSVGTITQLMRINEQGRLMPVSTADLEHFVTPATYNADGQPVSYTRLDELQDVYYGIIYLRAVTDGPSDGRRVAIYLDQTSAADGVLVQKDEEDSLLPNAARLGLLLSGNSPVIFYLSEEHNPEGQRQRNTYLNGELQEEGIVLDSGGDRIVAVPDPAVPLSAYALTDEGLPEQPLGYIETNQDYGLVVYFYLEGCDPDCWDPIAFDGSDLHLAFYGALA